jgi:hypothetical protein
LFSGNPNLPAVAGVLLALLAQSLEGSALCEGLQKHRNSHFNCPLESTLAKVYQNKGL